MIVVAVRVDCDTALVHLKDAVAVKVVNEVSVIILFRCQAAVQLHHKVIGIYAV